MFQQFWITIAPEDYIFDVKGDGTLCTILLLKNQQDFFLLGQPVFQGYYTTHNMSTTTIVFSPLDGSNKKPLQKGMIPTTVLAKAAPPTFV